MIRRWMWVVVLGVGLSWAWGAQAQTMVGVGVKIPIELASFTVGSVTDNWEIFGRLSVGAFALELGFFFPTVPLIVSAHATWVLSDVTDQALLFVGVGGYRIFIGPETFTGFDAKVGLEWPFPEIPVRAIMEVGWQSSVEIPLAGAGGAFVSLGLRWDWPAVLPP
ncbi:MAG: hypothetical protein RMJ29_07270 [Candidatus Bipolaricaulota bacterium]|nr:hypothetical protein [Candidatus Bipolaricaulota bacterium]